MTADWQAFYIFDAPAEQVERMMSDDPGVPAGIFDYEIHPIRSFPGDHVPA